MRSSRVIELLGKNAYRPFYRAVIGDEPRLPGPVFPASMAASLPVHLLICYCFLFPFFGLEPSLTPAHRREDLTRVGSERKGRDPRDCRSSERKLSGRTSRCPRSLSYCQSQ